MTEWKNAKEGAAWLALATRRQFMLKGAKWSLGVIAAVAGMAGLARRARAYGYAWSLYNNWRNYSNWRNYYNYYNWHAWINWRNYYNWSAWHNVFVKSEEKGEWASSVKAQGLLGTTESYDFHLARFLAEQGLDRYTTMLRKGVAAVRTGGDRQTARALLQTVDRELVLNADRQRALELFAGKNGLEVSGLKAGFDLLRQVTAAYLGKLR